MRRRWPSLLLIAALLAGGILVGRDITATDATAEIVDPAGLAPVAAPDDALDAVWSCAGQSAGEDTVADATIVVANVGDAPAIGVIEVVVAGIDGERASTPIEVPPDTTERVALSDLVEADWVAAQVRTRGGTVVVEREVVGERGRDVAPCHSRGSSRWWLPAGASTRDATMTLAIYNPSAGQARVDLGFSVEGGLRTPNDLQGLAIAPGALTVVDVSSVVTERSVLATTVVATRGQVVVDRIQTYDGEGAATTDEEAEAETYRPVGLALTPGVPAARTVWSFPGGVRSGYVHERVTLFNPGEELAEVELGFALDEPDRNGVLDPFSVSVPAGGTAEFEVDEIDTIPVGVTHSLVIRSENGVPVVAERSLFAAGGDAGYLGLATSTGSPVAADRWAFAAGPADDEVGRIVLANHGDSEVTVEVAAFGDGGRDLLELDEDGATEVVLAPGARREIRIGDLPEGRRSTEVVATGPVVVERRIFVQLADPADAEAEVGLGASTALGVALRDGLVVLD